ncbi:MAG TPA: hypothetical protein VN648_08760, partial [Candidatus Methylomirabilis sp.]|nr:hypothetical protein [Candidatus Methylomirabilis sp.]
MEIAQTRKHVLTEARLRANRANLEKARAVPREIRARMTEKRLAACRANLAKGRAAKQKLRESPDPDIWPSLQASLRTAGEKLEDFRAHLKKFQRGLRPRDGMEMRLVRGLAEAAWRRLRVFRGQARREAREVAAVLRRFAGRVKATDPSPGRQSDHPLPKGEGSKFEGDAAPDPLAKGEGSESGGGVSRDPLAKGEGSKFEGDGARHPVTEAEGS